jgi:pimeloyl-ACP methyl ester carboxylesterase
MRVFVASRPVRFVLVHGGFHGAWCWEKVVPHLEALGHRTAAIDLPGSGERIGERASHASWRAAFREVVEDGDVLVGHSQGGFAISLAADEVPDRVGRLVYLSAAVPIEGEPMASATSGSTELWPETTGLPVEEFMSVMEVPVQGPCVAITNPAAANAVFYHDCHPDDQAWAFSRLTPLPLGPTLEPFVVPRFWAARIPRDYILCTDDRSHTLASDNEFMRRLGLTTCLGVVSSHSPFISRPAETARLLDACASPRATPIAR